MKTKTYNDLRIEEAKDREALELFNTLYEKMLTLSPKEIEFIRESVESERCSDAEGIDKMLEDQSNEGLIGGIIGGITGLAFGSKIGNAICKALGITSGPLYQLLNSKVVTTAICTYLGIKM